MSSLNDNNLGKPTSPKSNATWGWILGAIVIAWAVLMMVFAPKMNPGKPDLTRPPDAIKPIAYNWSLQELDGRIVPFEEFKGKVVFVNFWATWCGPCVSEMPSIDALASEKSLKDVVFLGISVDEEPEAITRFVASQKPKFRVLRPVGEVPGQLITEGIPATFIIGPTGEILLSHVGSATWDSPEVVSLLQRMAAEAGTH